MARLRTHRDRSVGEVRTQYVRDKHGNLVLIEQEGSRFLDLSGFEFAADEIQEEKKEQKLGNSLKHKTYSASVRKKSPKDSILYAFFVFLILGFLCFVAITSHAIAEPINDYDTSINSEKTSEETKATIKEEVDKLKEELKPLEKDYQDVVNATFEIENQSSSNKEKLEEAKQGIEEEKRNIEERTIELYKSEENWFEKIFVSDPASRVNIENRLSQRNIDELSEIVYECEHYQEKIDKQLIFMDSLKEKASEKITTLNEKVKVLESLNVEVFSKSIPYDSVVANKIAKRALDERGKPYEWGAVGPKTYDCSGLVSYAITGEHRRIGTTHTFMGWEEIDMKEAKIGDICTSWEHCGVYLGEGLMVHAPETGDVVKVSYVQKDMKFVRVPEQYTKEISETKK